MTKEGFNYAKLFKNRKMIKKYNKYLKVVDKHAPIQIYEIKKHKNKNLKNSLVEQYYLRKKKTTPTNLNS